MAGRIKYENPDLQAMLGGARMTPATERRSPASPNYDRGSRITPSSTRAQRDSRRTDRAASRGFRAPTASEERRTQGAPGQGGLNDRGRPAPGGGIEDLLAQLFGGGQGDMSAQIGASYDGEIAALQGHAGELGGLTNQLIGNINSSADATNDQIGGYFGYAADQANAARPVIQQTGDRAQANIDSIYDTLASNLGAAPGQAVAQASAAAGGEIGGSVAGRVAAATAPFAAAGETSRATGKANMVQHSAAGQDYLSQLASAAPSEAAQSQAGVSGRANMAVTEAEMALSQQRAELSAQTAALEGAKQRAMIEHSADLSGSTFDRIMQTTQLYNALGADTSPLLNELGMSPAPGGGAFYEDQLDIGIKEQRLADMLAPPEQPTEGLEGFQAALGQQSGGVQQMGMELLNLIDAQGLDQQGVNQIIDRLTQDGGTVENKWAHNQDWIPDVLKGNREVTYQNGEPTAGSLDELFVTGPDGKMQIDPEGSMFSAVDPEVLRQLTRILFQ